MSTKYGNVNTDHILFIASGAFHSAKPSDLIAELQGRLPIKVKMSSLTEGDFVEILTKTESNLIKQNQALLEVEGSKLQVSEDVFSTNIQCLFGKAIRAIARAAALYNDTVENIGARALHTVVEQVLKDVSFDASEGDVVDVTSESVLGTQM